MAPHTQEEVISEDWNRPYSRQQAAFPAVSLFYLVCNQSDICCLCFNKSSYHKFSAIRQGRDEDLADGRAYRRHVRRQTSRMHLSACARRLLRKLLGYNCNKTACSQSHNVMYILSILSQNKYRFLTTEFLSFCKDRSLPYSGINYYSAVNYIDFEQVAYLFIL